MKLFDKSFLILLLLCGVATQAATTVTNIAPGSTRSLFIKPDGTLWAMGNNGYGQLGSGNFVLTNRPLQIVTNEVIAIAGGGELSLFVKLDGSLWAIGNNFAGQLGDGTFSLTNRPKQIVSNGCVTVACGESHGLLLRSDGSLWAMGMNAYGQLGDGAPENPRQIVGSGVIAIAADGDNRLFINSDGSLWTLGNNYFGQLGIHTTGFGTNSPQKIIEDDVAAIAGGTHAMFLKSDGSLWAMGHNSGELGDGFNTASLIPEQIYPSPPPLLVEAISAGTNLQISATCKFGGAYYLLAGTNLSQPLNQWPVIATSVINSRNNSLFSATITNAIYVGNQQNFYVLQS